MAVGEKSDVSDPVEAVGDGVLKEAADEFVGREPHDLGFAVLAVKVGDERRAVFRRPVSRRLFPNRTCAFRYVSGSLEDMAKFGVLIQARRYRWIGVQASKCCSVEPSRQRRRVRRRLLG
jgi:hypothetical protein